MKQFPLHTLVLLCVLLHFSSCSEAEGRSEPLFVRFGGKVTIKCSITNPDQDGVYLYTRREETGKNETVLYYFKDGTLTPETPYKGRVKTNRDIRDFSVSISNLSVQDSGAYWCKFNKLDANTVSKRTRLFVKSEYESRCVPMFVHVGENVTIECSITNPDQDEVYLLTQREEISKEEKVFHYNYRKDGVLSTETRYKDRVEFSKALNGDFSDFTVSISNVSEQDSGVYWCRFNKLNKQTFSERMCLFVQSGTICTEERDWNQFIYLAVICAMFLIILFLAIVLAKTCSDREKSTPKEQPSNGVYEVMRSNTMTALTNPAYESSRRRTQSQLC